MWLVAGDTFGRRAASGFAAGAVSRVAKLAEGRLSSSPLFSKARKTTKAQWQRAICAPLRRRLARRRRYPPPKSGAQKLRWPSRWRPLEQGLWRRPLSVWQGAAPEAVWLRWLIEHGEAYECDATRTDTMIQACIMHTWPCEIGPRV